MRKNNNFYTTTTPTIVNLYNSNTKLKAIAAQTGVGIVKVRKILKAAGVYNPNRDKGTGAITRGYRPYSVMDKSEKDIWADRLRRYTLAQVIRDNTGVSFNTLKLIADEYGINLRDRSVEKDIRGKRYSDTTKAQIWAISQMSNMPISKICKMFNVLPETGREVIKRANANSKYRAYLTKIIKEGSSVITQYNDAPTTTYTDQVAERRKLNAALRKAVLARDNNCCQICGISKDITPLEIHHILPISEGGKTELDNLQAICHSCHSKITYKN